MALVVVTDMVVTPTLVVAMVIAMATVTEEEVQAEEEEQDMEEAPRPEGGMDFLLILPLLAPPVPQGTGMGKVDVDSIVIIWADTLGPLVVIGEVHQIGEQEVTGEAWVWDLWGALASEVMVCQTDRLTEVWMAGEEGQAWDQGTATCSIRHFAVAVIVVVCMPMGRHPDRHPEVLRASMVIVGMMVEIWDTTVMVSIVIRVPVEEEEVAIMALTITAARRVVAEIAPETDEEEVEEETEMDMEVIETVVGTDGIGGTAGKLGKAPHPSLL